MLPTHLASSYLISEQGPKHGPLQKHDSVTETGSHGTTAVLADTITTYKKEAQPPGSEHGGSRLSQDGLLTVDVAPHDGPDRWVESTFPFSLLTSLLYLLMSLIQVDATMQSQPSCRREFKKHKE